MRFPDARSRTFCRFGLHPWRPLVCRENTPRPPEHHDSLLSRAVAALRRNSTEIKVSLIKREPPIRLEKEPSRLLSLIGLFLI